MQLADRIEKRRFVGREFLLFLWFESEIFDATLRTREHGRFGLWLERNLVLAEGKESTRITAPLPGAGREAKEALLRGQLPQSAGIRLALNSEETSFVLKADSLGIAGLKLRTALDKDEEGVNPLLEELLGKPKGKPRGKASQADEADGHYEVFYERMTMTTDFEALFECLYRDFLKLRLTAAWREVVTPLLRLWVQGREFPLDAYEALRHPPVAPARSLDLTPVTEDEATVLASSPAGRAVDGLRADDAVLEEAAEPDDDVAAEDLVGVAVPTLTEAATPAE